MSSDNFIHDEKLFHAIIDFLVPFTVKLSVSELTTLGVDKTISGSSYIFPAPIYSLISFACRNRGSLR